MTPNRSAADPRRQRLERLLPMMRLGCMPAILGWFALGYIFDAPGMYVLAIVVVCMLLSIYAYGLLIRLRGDTPELGVFVIGITVSAGAASTGYFAPWAVGGLVCVVTFGGLFIIAFTERRAHAPTAFVTVLLGLACLAGGLLTPVTDAVPTWARLMITAVAGLVGMGLMMFAQMEALADERQAKAVLERGNRELAERERQLLRISRSPVLEEGELLAAYRLVTSAAQSALGVRRASIWLFDEAAQGMALALLRDGDTENTGPLVLPYAAYPRYFAALRGSRVLLAHEARSDPATSEFAEGYLAPLDIHSMLDAGIHFGGRSVGVLCCEHTGAPRQWTEQEGFFAGALADALSRALAAAEKRKADEALRELNARLEDRVAERTATAEQAQQRLLNITDSISGLVYEYRRRADGGHSAPFVSSGVEQLLGLPRATVAGDVDRFFALVLPEDLPAYAEDIQRSADQGVDHRYIFRIRHAASGEVRWMLTSARAPQRDDDGTMIWRGYVIDITDQKQLEAELHRTRDLAEVSRRRISEMADNVPGVVYRCRLDASWTMLFISSGVTLLTGHPASDFIGNAVRSYASVIHPDDLAEVDRVVNGAVEARQPYAMEYRVIDRQGGVRWVLERGRASFDADGVAEYLDGSVTDISEQKQLSKALTEARDLAAEASKTKSEFLANMSHEIRTPMNAIIGLSHLALKTSLDKRQHDYVTKIHNSAQSLLGIINDILDLSKIEAGKLGIENTEFDLLEVLDNLASLISVKAEEKGLEFLISAAPGLPYFLIGDPLRLGQILLNLAGNAVKFTAQGQVMVSVTEVPGSRSDSLVGLRFAVSDTGIGLTEEQRGRLFQAFSQADASTTRKYGGTGLGLTISKQLAELMGGEIGVDSVSGEGSTFWFTVTAGIAAERRRGMRGTAEALQGRRVLVVDDNGSARSIVESYVTSFGMAPRQAASGEQAIAMVQTAQAEGAPYELVLMDWQMPGLNGIEAARRIRQLDASPKIVLLTAHGREEVVRSAEEAKLDGFLVKPVNPSLLLDASLVALFGGTLAGGGARRERGDENANVLRGLSVLLAEDNEINQQVAREVLEGFGVQVDIAANGRLAVERLRAAQRPYSLVLMDMQMPEMDGLAATRAIRADVGIAHLPIIAMTANAMQADRQACVDAGMDDFISKPFKPKELLRLLQKWGWGESTASPAEAPTEPDARGTQVFNLEDGVDRVGSEAMLLRLSRQLFGQPQAAVADIAALVAAGDREAALRAAHSAAGASSLLGFEQLAAAARTLEAQLKQGAPFAEALRAVQQAFAAAQAALETRAAPAPQAAAPLLDSAALDSLVEQLGGQIDSYDTQATETLATLREALGVGAPDLLEQIDGQLGRFDFDGAAALLAPLRAALAAAAAASAPG